MNNECIFCKIIKKEIPSKIIYEDEFSLCFLDLNQDYPGHLLIIPKKHTLDINSIDKDTLNKIHDLTIKMNDLLKEKLKCDGLTLFQNNGIAQEVKHFHLHLIPKYENKPIMNLEEIYNKLTH